MKVRITESQYKRLILKESKELEFSYDLDTILGFAKLIGLPLKNQNEFLADRSLKNPKILEKIYTILTNSEEEKKMAEDLVNKGMKGGNEKIIKNVETIINNFNKHANDNGLDKKLTLNKVMNQILRK